MVCRMKLTFSPNTSLCERRRVPIQYCTFVVFSGVVPTWPAQSSSIVQYSDGTPKRPFLLYKRRLSFSTAGTIFGVVLAYNLDRFAPDAQLFSILRKTVVDLVLEFGNVVDAPLR